MATKLLVLDTACPFEVIRRLILDLIVKYPIFAIQ